MQWFRRGRMSFTLLVALLVVAGTSVFFVPSFRQTVFGLLGGSSARFAGKFVLHEVSTGPFRIEITENGKIDSERNATLSNSVEGSRTIISLIPEGTRVGPPTVAEFDGVVQLLDSPAESIQGLLLRGEEPGVEKQYDITLGDFIQLLVTDDQRVEEGDYLAGALVCELDSSMLVESELQQQIRVTDATANLEKCDKTVQITETTNEKMLSVACLAEELAQLDLEKYIAKDGEYEQALQTIEGEVKQTEEELAIAQEEYDRILDQARRGYTSLNNLEAARVKVTQKQIFLNVKKGELTVLNKFTRKRTEAELHQMAEDTVRDTARVILESEAAMAQEKAALFAAKLTLKVEEETLSRLRRQIAACLLVAPQAGEVVYATQASRRSEPIVVELGASVRQRQAVIKLPDLDHMKVDARIHESRIRQVAVGQLVEISVASLPDLDFHGVLNSLSSVPVPGEWPNTSLMEFEAEITITDPTEMKRQLKPQMTAELRIIVEDRTEAVLQIPVQSVLPLVGQFFAYVLVDGTPERRGLMIGMSNDEFVEVLDGVAVGEQVIMNPRTQFSQEINNLEKQLLSEFKEIAGTPQAASRRPSEKPAGGRPPRVRNQPPSRVP